MHYINSSGIRVDKSTSCKLQSYHLSPVFSSNPVQFRFTFCDLPIAEMKYRSAEVLNLRGCARDQELGRYTVLYTLLKASTPGRTLPVR